MDQKSLELARQLNLALFHNDGRALVRIAAEAIRERELIVDEGSLATLREAVDTVRHGPDIRSFPHG